MSSLALGVPLTVVSVLGLLLNGYILLVVVLSKQLQTANNLLLLHLGVVDSLLCVVFLLFAAPGLLRGGGPGAAAGGPVATGAGAGSGGVAGVGAMTGPLCAIHGFLFTLLHPVALWTVCGLNCDRYYAISAPLHYTNLVSTRKVAACLGASWLLALTMALPPLFLSGPGYRYTEQGAAGCAPHFTAPAAPAPMAAVWYSGVYTILMLLLPAALILGCNIKVLMIARYHRHRIASAIYEVTLSAQVTITHQRNPFYLSQFRGRSAVFSVLQLLGSLLLLYFPYYGVLMWEALASALSWGSTPPPHDGSTPVPHHQSSGHVHPHVVSLASALLTCSPPINGFIYGVKSKVLRKTFSNFWRKQMSKSEVNHEIQARTPSACGSRRPSLTPLGLLGGRTAPPPSRRLSEVLLEPGGRFGMTVGCSPHRPRLLKRMATELSWRPALLAAATSVDLDTRLKRSRSARDGASLRRGGSCNNMLQVPKLTSPCIPDPQPTVACVSSPPKLRSSASAASLLVQRVLLRARPRTPPPTRRSPRILITRAFSQDRSDSPGSTPFVLCAEPPAQLSSSSTAALLQPDPTSSPESPDAGGETEDESRESLQDEELVLPAPSLHIASQRVCFSLDDVSRTSPGTAPSSPPQQPSSLPPAPAPGAKNPSWLRSLQYALLSRSPRQRPPSTSSATSLMSWPLRSAHPSGRLDLAVAKSCCDVSMDRANVI